MNNTNPTEAMSALNNNISEMLSNLKATKGEAHATIAGRMFVILSSLQELEDIGCQSIMLIKSICRDDPSVSQFKTAADRNHNLVHNHAANISDNLEELATILEEKHGYVDLRKDIHMLMQRKHNDWDRKIHAHRP